MRNDVGRIPGRGRVLRAIYRSTFAPQEVVGDPTTLTFVLRYGWVLIVVRWAYYSLLFQFRDYHGRWTPFVAPPFGLSLDSYASLQRSLSLPFGLVLMAALALVLVAYLRLIGRPLRFLDAYNVLGVAFFLPFVLVQPVDQIVIALVGWQLVPVTVIHTAVLFWESWAAMRIISGLAGLTRAHEFTGGLLVCAVWIAITGVVWR